MSVWVLWQMNWWACVLLAGQGFYELSALSVLPGVGWAIKRKWVQASTLGATLVAGLVAEQVFYRFGAVGYRAESVVVESLAPWFLWALWLNMGLIVKPLYQRFQPFTVDLAFGLGAPLAYYGGQQLGCIQFSADWQDWCLVGAVYVFTLRAISRNMPLKMMPCRG